MAGTDPRFNATKFRDAIRFVFEMSSPTISSEDISFHWKSESTFQREDGSNNPFDWTATPVTTNAPSDLQVPCTVDFANQTAGGGRQNPAGNAVGEFDYIHGVVTILDQEWQQVLAHGGRRPDQCIIDGDLYDVMYLAAPIGLFDVTVYELHIEAVDEH